MLAGFHAMIRQIASYPAPIAALVEGSCLGGAFELILACHLVFAAPSAILGCPEVKLGVFPPVLAAIGAQRLGGPLMEKLILTGMTIDAAAAERAGLASAIFAGGNPEEELIVFTTIFRTKGLEYDYVVLPQCDDNLLPYLKGFPSMKMC